MFATNGLKRSGESRSTSRMRLIAQQATKAPLLF
jgi:hypothetical protein